jgi:hypothetical protein
MTDVADYANNLAPYLAIAAKPQAFAERVME